MSFVYDVPVEFKLKEKVLSHSGDGFSIKRIDTDEDVFVVHGSSMGFRESKALYDCDGNALYKMKNAMISMRSRMYIEDLQSGETAVTLRRKSIIPMFGKSTIQVWKGDDDDGAPWLEIKGGFRKKDFGVKDVESGTEIARIRKKSMNLLNFVFDKDTYVVNVEAGQNTALIVFLAVAIDEQFHDEESAGHSGGGGGGGGHEEDGSSSSSSSDEEEQEEQQEGEPEEEEGGEEEDGSSSSSSSDEEEQEEQQEEEPEEEEPEEEEYEEPDEGGDE